MSVVLYLTLLMIAHESISNMLYGVELSENDALVVIIYSQASEEYY